MAAKKDLTGAINTGIDRLFSANDPQQEQQTQQTQEVTHPHKAEEVSNEQRAADVDEMAAMTAAAEARKTAGRKGYKMQRLNISLTPSEYEYITIMAGITGKSLTRFIGDLIDRDKAANADTYKKAREIINNAR